MSDISFARRIGKKTRCVREGRWTAQEDAEKLLPSWLGKQSGPMRGRSIKAVRDDRRYVDRIFPERRAFSARYVLPWSEPPKPADQKRRLPRSRLNQSSSAMISG